MPRLKRGERIDDRRQRPIIDFDQLKRILGEITVDRDHDCDRLADVAHALDCDRPAFDRCLDADCKACRQRLDVGAGDHRHDPRRLLGGGNVDRADASMSMRGAKNGGVTGAGRHADIIDETATAGEQRQVFDPLD